MSPDRVIYSFILGWVLLIAVLIALDWIGNPNRGGFRPKGDRPARDRSTRKSERARRKLEGDASIRAALRDAYGASSLRLTWDRDSETKARGIDDALVVVDPHDDVVETESREIVRPDYTAIAGDALPNPTELASDPEPDPAGEPDSEPEPEAHEPPRPTGWVVGVDPLALTKKGTEPAPATIRTRVWKNHANAASWDDDNLARLRGGKPPRRTNPITGRVERATVDLATGQASWGSEPFDPFGDVG